MSNQTVIGVFATKTQAQNAVQALQGAGYDSAAIDFMSDDSYRDTNMRAKREERNKGFFASLFSDDDDYDYNNLHETARRGNVVTVHTNDMSSAERAADILDQYGAINSDEAATKLRDDDRYTETTPLAEAHSELSYADNYRDTYDATAAAGTQTIDVVKEDVAIGKREVNTGGVRVRSRIISRPVQEQVRLREEHVFVTRTPVDKPVDANTLDAFQEKTISLTETAEEAVVQKSARVVEQVQVGKEHTEHTETIQETVRETEVDVERVAGETAGTIGTATNATASTVGQKVDNAGNKLHNALDRDNDGELVDLNDNDGRIG